MAAVQTPELGPHSDGADGSDISRVTLRLHDCLLLFHQSSNNRRLDRLNPPTDVKTRSSSTRSVSSRNSNWKPRRYHSTKIPGIRESCSTTTILKLPLLQLSYHKFNETQREQTVLKRLKEGEIVALISDAGMPGISDPGTELAKLCVHENIPVIPIPGPSAFVAALSASGLSTDEFTFVGFLSKHAGSRRERLMVSANEATTQIFYVPPHKLRQFLEEASSLFGVTRQCVIAREITKVHEEFWRGTLGEAEEVFSTRTPRGEITVLVERKENSPVETPSESQLEDELRDLISNGHSLSTAVKLVADGTSVRKKTIYSIALRKFGKQLGSESHEDPCKRQPE